MKLSEQLGLTEEEFEALKASAKHQHRVTEAQKYRTRSADLYYNNLQEEEPEKIDPPRDLAIKLQEQIDKVRIELSLQNNIFNDHMGTHHSHSRTRNEKAKTTGGKGVVL